jgi:putative ABC transport system ATP-binding protein
VYVVEQGTVTILREFANGSTDTLAVVPAGQYFGELGAILGFPRSATAVAGDQPVTLTALSPHEFRRRVEQRPH